MDSRTRQNCASEQCLSLAFTRDQTAPGSSLSRLKRAAHHADDEESGWRSRVSAAVAANHAWPVCASDRNNARQERGLFQRVEKASAAVALLPCGCTASSRSVRREVSPGMENLPFHAILARRKSVVSRFSQGFWHLFITRFSVPVGVEQFTTPRIEQHRGVGEAVGVRHGVLRSPRLQGDAVRKPPQRRSDERSGLTDRY